MNVLLSVFLILGAATGGLGMILLVGGALVTASTDSDSSPLNAGISS